MTPFASGLLCVLSVMTRQCKEDAIMARVLLTYGFV